MAAMHLPPEVNNMLEKDERVLFSIRRHIIGIIFIYLQVLGAVLAIVLIAYVALPSLLDSLSGQAARAVYGLGVIATALLVFILLIATYVYRLSMLVVTNKNLIQVTQTGLFVRKVSRFTMSDVEDVTAEQKGLFATLFIYGNLVVQTAGTQDNFNFQYCPDPNKYAHLIIEASHAAENQAND